MEGLTMQIGVVGTGQKMIVICVKYVDAATTRMTPAAWITTLAGQANPYYQAATFGETDFTFELPVGVPGDGWLSLGYANSNYDYYRTGQDAINAANPYVDFSQYNRVLVITNWPGFGGQGLDWNWWHTANGVEQTLIESGVPVGRRFMTLSIVNEWHAHDYGRTYDEACAVMCHEIGHQLILPTHYSDLRWSPSLPRDSITPWDVMGRSPMQTHFTGWAKADRGWIAGPRVLTVGPPSGGDIDQSVTLKPVETHQNNGTQMIQVPFSSSPPMAGYVLENRRRLNADDEIPRQGVLVSLVDRHPDVPYGLNQIVINPPTAPDNNYLAGLALGESFHDAERNLTVTVTAQSGDNATVRIQYPLPVGTVDPAITPWGAPPYWTPDIWIDSEKNGWGTYRYTDATGAPEGQGDDAWINHDNRVYVRVHNYGTREATDVRVQVFVNQPPGLGDAGPRWDFIGTIIFPSIAAGGAVTDYVIWRPTVAAHTCLRVVIEDTPEDLNSTNNRAQENIALFETSTGSPWHPVTTKLRIFNPHRYEETPAHIVVTDIPRGWVVGIEPSDQVLPPDGEGEVEISVYPAPEALPAYRKLMRRGEVSRDVPKYEAGFVGRLRITALVPHTDTFIPLGGVEAWVHLVRVAGLTCDRQRDGEREYVAGSTKPAVPDASVALEFRHGKERAVEIVRTDRRGRYQFPVEQRWNSVQAFFAGNDVFGSTQSERVRLGGRRVRRRRDDTSSATAD